MKLAKLKGAKLKKDDELTWQHRTLWSRRPRREPMASRRAAVSSRTAATFSILICFISASFNAGVGILARRARLTLDGLGTSGLVAGLETLGLVASRAPARSHVAVLHLLYIGKLQCRHGDQCEYFGALGSGSLKDIRTYKEGGLGRGGLGAGRLRQPSPLASTLDCGSRARLISSWARRQPLPAEEAADITQLEWKDASIWVTPT